MSDSMEAGDVPPADGDRPLPLDYQPRPKKKVPRQRPAFIVKLGEPLPFPRRTLRVLRLMIFLGLLIGAWFAVRYMIAYTRMLDGAFKR